MKSHDYSITGRKHAQGGEYNTTGITCPEEGWKSFALESVTKAFVDFKHELSYAYNSYDKYLHEGYDKDALLQSVKSHKWKAEKVMSWLVSPHCEDIIMACMPDTAIATCDIECRIKKILKEELKDYAYAISDL